MFKDLKALGRESVIYGFSTVVARLLNFFLVPFYTYFFVSADYGVVASVYSYIAFFNIIYQYAMDNAYMRFASEGGRTKSEIFSTPFWAVSLTALLISAILALNAGRIAALAGIGAGNGGLILYSALVLALDAAAIVPFAKLRLEHRAWRFVGVRTCNIIVNVAANVLLLAVFKRGVPGVLQASLLASAVSLVLLLPVIAEDLKPVFSGELFRSMFRFAWPFVPAGLASMAVQVIDRPILLFLTSASLVGIYQANYRMGIFMMLVVSMFDQAWRPFFLERANNPDAPLIFAKVFTYFAFLGSWIVLGLSFFLPDLIMTSFHGVYLLHPSYWGGLCVVPVVLTAYLFNGFYVNFMVAPVLSKKTGMLAWVTLSGALVNIAGNFLLIPRFSLMGAAWATLLSYAAMAAGLFFMGRRYYPVPYEFRKILYLALALAAMLEVYYSALTVFCDYSRTIIAIKALLFLSLPLVLETGGFFDAPLHTLVAKAWRAAAARLRTT